jgi:hypothetical protein
VFVNATGRAPAFERYAGAMAGIVAPYRAEDLTVGARHTYDVAANWKIIVENYHECYHCPLIHPELCQVSPPSSGANWDLPGAWVGGSMDLREHAETMSLSGRSAGLPLPGVDPRSVQYLSLFPNLLVSAHPDYVMTHRLTPLARGRPVVCGRLLGRDQPRGLGRLRVGPTGSVQPAFPAGPARSEGGRGLPVGDPAGPGLPRPGRRDRGRLRLTALSRCEVRRSMRVRAARHRGGFGDLPGVGVRGPDPGGSGRSGVTT